MATVSMFQRTIQVHEGEGAPYRSPMHRFLDGHRMQIRQKSRFRKRNQALATGIIKIPFAGDPVGHSVLNSPGGNVSWGARTGSDHYCTLANQPCLRSGAAGLVISGNLLNATAFRNLRWVIVAASSFSRR